ncbi:hypothetical protein CsatA_004050 [Cannabis sativa]
MAEMAEVVKEIRNGKCLLDDDDYDSQDEDENDFIIFEDERITRARELKASLPVSDSSDEEAEDEYEQDWAIVNKQLETDGFHVDYLPNQHKRNWYQKIFGQFLL